MAVTSTSVSPILTVTEPLAIPASLPVLTATSLPPTRPRTVISDTLDSLSVGREGVQLPVVIPR